MKQILRKYRMHMITNYRSLFLFELLFKTMFLILLVPLMNRSLQYVIHLWGKSYITFSNLLSFLTFLPAILMFIIIWIVLPVFILYEMTSLIQYCHDVSLEKRPDISSTLFLGIAKTIRSIIKGNIALPFFAFLMFLFTNVPLLFCIIIRFKIPVSLTQAASDSIFIKGLFIATLVLIILVAYRGIFTVHFCINEDMKFSDAMNYSKKLLKDRSLKTALLLFGVNAALFLFFIGLYYLLLTILAFLVFFFADKALVTVVFLTLYPQFNFYIAIFFSIIAFSVNMNLISSMYQEYRSEINREFLPNELITKDLKQPLPNKKHKRQFLVIMILLAGISTVNLLRSIHNDSFYLSEALAGIQITSHRGNSSGAPENTLPAIENAVNLYADYAEIDIQQTQDGIIVLLHDRSLKRITGLNKNVYSLTYDQLQTLDAGVHAGEEYKNTRIPTLEEVLAYCKGKIKLNIEIKINGHEQDLEEKLVELIKKYEFENQCVITSWNYNTLVKTKQLDENIKTGFILTYAYGNFYEKDNVDFFSIKSSFINRSIVEHAHKLGKEIHAWTVNSISEIDRMKSIGVDNIITDKPTLVLEVLYRDDTNDNLVQLLNKMIIESNKQ